MVEIVDFATGVEAYTGDGKGDGVRNAALSNAHVSGDHIHIAELKCPAVRITLKAADGNTAKGGSCEKRRISEKELESTVLAVLQSEIKLILNMERALSQIEELAWEHRETARLDKAIEVKTAEMEKCRTMKISIYEDLQDGLITQEEFLQMKDSYSQQIGEIEKDIGKLKKERAMIQDGVENRNGWLSQFRKYQNLPSLSRAAVVNLVDKIELYPDKKIRVVLRYQDQLANMMEFLQNQDAAEGLPEAEVS